MTKRTQYRPAAFDQLARIEKKRVELKISHEDLYQAADISRASYFRIRQDGHAFDKTVKALRFGLRTIEQRRRAAERILDGAGE